MGVAVKGLSSSDCRLSIFCTTTGEEEREMDGAQEGGRLKRQMKGQHTERRET